MPPLQTNATLTRVAGRGFTAEPGAERDSEPGPEKFGGSSRVYYREKEERTTTSAGRDVITRRTLIVDARDPAIEWETGDVAEFTVDGDAETSAAVVAVSGAKLGRMAGTGVETTRIELEPK